MKNFWDRNARFYDVFMKKDAAAYEQMYARRGGFVLSYHSRSEAFHAGCYAVSRGVSDLVFDGGGSIFVIDGKVTNIAVEDCWNITLRNLEIRHAHPDMHEFLVVRKSAFSVDFKIDSDSSFSAYALLC